MLKAGYSKLILSKKNPDPITFPNDIKTGEITIGEAKASQEDFSKYPKIMRRREKNKKQRKTLANINMLFNGRNEAIKFIRDYDSMILDAKWKAATEGTGLNKLTPKQMLQRLYQ